MTLNPCPNKPGAVQPHYLRHGQRHARTVLDKVEELICRYPEERATIQAALDTLRPRAGEPVARWLRQQGLLAAPSVEANDSLAPSAPVNTIN